LKRERRAPAAETLGGMMPRGDNARDAGGTAILSLNRKGVAVYNLLLRSNISFGSETGIATVASSNLVTPPRLDAGLRRFFSSDPHPRTHNMIFAI
jgi:hypothetical protein